MAVVNIHHPLAFTFGILGNLISIMVYLAPLPTFYRIYRKKSTEGFQSLPYLVALMSSMLWLYYALVKKDALLLTTINTLGCVVETIYIIMYLIYAPRDKRVSTAKLLVSMNIVSFSFVVLLMHFVAEGSVRIQVAGWICVAFSVSVFAAPLTIVAQVVRTRSVEFMPLPLSFFLTLSAVMWFSYGLFIKDICVALPNVLGFILGVLQMLLYGFYRNEEKAIIMDEKSVTDEKQLPDHNLRSIVILSTLGASEVYPVDAQPNQVEVAEEDEPKGQRKKCEKSMEGADDPRPNECAV